MSEPPHPKIPVGQVLAGKYRITREIGRGGMAAVYEAVNVDIQKRIAIKVLAAELTSSTVVVERFLREARAAAAIRSPFICDVYDSGRLSDGRPFLVLELLEGDSLYERMTKVRWLDLATALLVVTQTCRGLTRAHAASIVHRDLKPENLFLTKDEEGKVLTKILDFGLAKFYAPIEGSGSADQARLTREGAVFGTPAYMSPEQVRGQGEVDHRADLWALGCITYEILTGKTVWAVDQGVAMTFAQIASSELPDPARLRPDLPPAFTPWFRRALHRDIDQRFQTPRELSDELATALHHAPPSFPSLREPHSARGGALFAGPRVPMAPRLELVDTSTPPPVGAALELDLEAPLAPSPAVAAAPGLRVEAEDPGRAAPPLAGAAAAPSTPQDGLTVGDEPRLLPPSRVPRQHPRGRVRNLLVAAVGVALVGGVGYAGYREIAHPGAAARASAASSSAASAQRASASAASSIAAPAPVGGPAALSIEAPWGPSVSAAQVALSTGDLKGALDALAEAVDKGPHGAPRALREHVVAAQADGGPRGPCGLTGLARPRAYDLGATPGRPVAAGPPSIAVGPRGAVVLWTDAHDAAGNHAFVAPLDEALRDVGDPVDVTPEGTSIGRPQLAPIGDRFALSYWDAKGSEAGVSVRWLDAQGRIAGPVVRLSPPKGFAYFPALARAEEGWIFVAWSDESDTGSEDLFLRRLGPSLDPVGDVLRVTDLVSGGGVKSRARLPALAAAGGALQLVYRLERDPQRLIQAMRLLPSALEKGLGPRDPSGRSPVPLPARRAPGRVDRTLAEAVLVNGDRARADGPSTACGGGACFVVWHGDSPAGGASAAALDPTTGKPIWRKRFSVAGGRPAVAARPEGGAQLVWFEGGFVMTASLGQGGVGPASRVARVTGDQPTPSIAPGRKPGEWYLAWLNYEAGHLEPFAARIQCR